MAECRITAAAERDLEGIWKYTRREWGLEQAERYVDLLSAAFRAVMPFARPIDNYKCGDILTGCEFAAGEQPFFRRRPMTLRSLQTTSSHILI